MGRQGFPLSPSSRVKDFSWVVSWVSVVVTFAQETVYLPFEDPVLKSLFCQPLCDLSNVGRRISFGFVRRCRFPVDVFVDAAILLIRPHAERAQSLIKKRSTDVIGPSLM